MKGGEDLTRKEELYNLYNDSKIYDNREAAMLLNWDEGFLRKVKSILKSEGYIDVSPDGVVTCIKPIKTAIEGGKLTLKSAIYREMLDIYMDDFRAQESFKDRVIVGQEIRQILKSI